MLSAKQGNYWYQTREPLLPFIYCLWYDVVLDWRLNPGPPALEATTLPLGYQGGGPDWGLNPGPPALEASTLSPDYRGGGPSIDNT